jgi:NADH-quinone oxidoreductase subunit L
MFDLNFDLERALVWIVLLPLLGALINGVAGGRANKSLVSGVAVGSVFLSFLISLMGFGSLLTSGGFFEAVGLEGDGRHAIVQDVYEWFSISVGGVEVPIRVRFVMDHLSGLMAVMVSGIAMLIHVYSTGYMSEDPGYARFMTYLNLFTASMLVLVLASSMPLMFVGWEGVGLCSYLLIGFWYTNADYAAAGRKAFVMNRIGDFGVLMGMFLLVSTVADGGSGDAFEFAQINAAAGRLATTNVAIGPAEIGITVGTAAALFIFLGCTGKSAQIPLYTWLPDAMAGPTPVSALIHAATMVTAGVYLCFRLSPVISESEVAMAIIAITGTLTAFLAATIALVQNQMKRVLAYSTVSQLGFMFAAVGVGAFGAGFFHVFTHAFFKACLFLGAGSVMHAVHAHGDADIRYLGGLKKWMPKTRLTFLISTAAIAGLPPLAGFFSKDEILLGAASWGALSETPWNPDRSFGENMLAGAWAGPWVGWFVFVMLLITAAMTAFYMFRLYFRTFEGTFKGGHPPKDAHADHAHGDHDHEEHHEPHESPDSMTIPLWVLATGAALVGFLGLPHAFHLPSFWGEWFANVDAGDFNFQMRGFRGAPDTLVFAVEHLGSPITSALTFGEEHTPMWLAGIAMGAGLLAGLGGTALAYVWYVPQDGAPAESLKNAVPGLHKFLMNKWYVDELYRGTIVRGNEWLAVLSANVDRVVVDGLLAKVSALGVKTAGYAMTRTQTGAVYAYAAMFVGGLVVLGWWFTYPHPSLEGEGEVRTVTWSAGEGLGYEYRWDFADGEFEAGATEWSREASQVHDYQGGEREGRAYWGLVALLESPRDLFGADEVILRENGAPEALDQYRNLDLGMVALREGEEESEGSPTVAYRRVAPFQGSVPAERRPRQPEAQAGQPPPAPVRLDVEVSLYEQGSHNRERLIWGPEPHSVIVDEGGGLSLLMGSRTSLPASRIAAIRERTETTSTTEDGVFVELTVDGERVGDRVAFEGDVAPAMVFRINDAGIPDDDGIDDGLLVRGPGDSLTFGQERITVGVRVRATVEVRNTFGNVGRSTEEVTLRVAGGSGRHGSARAEVTP